MEARPGPSPHKVAEQRAKHPDDRERRADQNEREQQLTQVLRRGADKSGTEYAERFVGLIQLPALQVRLERNAKRMLCSYG